MSQGRSIKRNFVFNLFYQILAIVVPFITTPYVSRILGPENIGIYSYTYSIVTYFVLIATLGTTTFGQRETAFYQVEPYKRSVLFWEVVILRIFTTLICFICYMLYVQMNGYNVVYMAQAINIIAVACDVTWFFQGLEEFEKLAVRNCLIKIINIVCVFAFVKERDDLLIYVLCLAVIPIIGNCSVFSYLPRYLVRVSLKDVHPFSNIRLVLQLFVPQIAIQLYTIFDKTMIGLITGSSLQNGYYEQAEKISKISLTIITALGTVMGPRIAFSYAQNNIELLKKYMYMSYRFVWFLSIPCMFGLMAIASNFVPWFLGDEYIPVVPLVSVMSALIVIIGLSNTTGVQYLIPTNQQKKFTLTVVSGAITNFVFNLIFIVKFGALGASIATLIAEFVVTMTQFICIRKQLDVKFIFSMSLKYLFAGLIMGICVFLVGIKLPPTIVNTIFLILVGAVVYIMILLIFRDSIIVELVQKIRTNLLGFMSNK